MTRFATGTEIPQADVNLCARRSGRTPCARAVARLLPLTRRMECWIDVAEERDRCLVRVAGRLGAEQVPDLLQACGSDARKNLVLDLGELLNVDGGGCQALLALRRRGATFVGLPEYIRLKLESATR